MAYIIADIPSGDAALMSMTLDDLGLLPVMGLVFIVIGSMYFGWATATKAAAVGVVGALWRRCSDL